MSFRFTLSNMPPQGPPGGTGTSVPSRSQPPVKPELYASNRGGKSDPGGNPMSQEDYDNFLKSREVHDHKMNEPEHRALNFHDPNRLRGSSSGFGTRQGQSTDLFDQSDFNTDYPGIGDPGSTVAEAWTSHYNHAKSVIEAAMRMYPSEAAGIQAQYLDTHYKDAKAFREYRTSQGDKMPWTTYEMEKILLRYPKTPIPPGYSEELRNRIEYDRLIIQDMEAANEVEDATGSGETSGSGSGSGTSGTGSGSGSGSGSGTTRTPSHLRGGNKDESKTTDPMERVTGKPPSSTTTKQPSTQPPSTQPPSTQPPSTQPPPSPQPVDDTPPPGPENRGSRRSTPIQMGTAFHRTFDRNKDPELADALTNITDYVDSKDLTQLVDTIRRIYEPAQRDYMIKDVLENPAKGLKEFLSRMAVVGDYPPLAVKYLKRNVTQYVMFTLANLYVSNNFRSTDPKPPSLKANTWDFIQEYLRLNEMREPNSHMIEPNYLSMSNLANFP